MKLFSKQTLSSQESEEAIVQNFGELRFDNFIYNLKKTLNTTLESYQWINNLKKKDGKVHRKLSSKQIYIKLLTPESEMQSYILFPMANADCTTARSDLQILCKLILDPRITKWMTKFIGNKF